MSRTPTGSDAENDPTAGGEPAGEGPSAAMPGGSATGGKVRLFLSYGRADAEDVAERLEADLSRLDFDVWRDRRMIRSGRTWDDQIEAGLRASQLIVAVLTPHAVREESVCRDELMFAHYACELPILPVMVHPCVPPLVIFRLDYIDLTAWRDSEDQYKLGFKRLIDHIQALLRGEPPRYRRWDDRFPRFDFGLDLHDKRRDFRGREWLFERIEAWRTKPGQRRVLLITGDPGIGKSALVAQLVHLKPEVLAYHCCRADMLETLRPARFIRGLAGMIASQLEGFASQLDTPKVETALSEARCETDPASAFEEGILEPLHRLPSPPDGARYILIDALDEALATRDGMSLITLLSPSRLDRLPGWLRIVATTRKEPDVLRRLGSLRAEEIQADAPENLDDIKKFLAHRLGQPRLRERLQSAGVRAEDAVALLRDKSGGNFLWAAQALVGLEDGTYDFAQLDALPPGLAGLYLAFFERHFPDAASYAPARQVLEVVAAAREPLNAPEIAATTGLDPDYELPALLDRLAAYLPTDREGRRTLYHKSLADWLTDAADPHPAGRFFVSLRRGHERLAAWCWAEYQRGAGRMPAYSLRHISAHLGESARWDDLAALLRNLPHLEAKAEAGDVFDLAMDFTRAVKRMPADHPAARHLRLLEQALRSDLHLIARHPKALFQCLWNRGWWYDCDAAAAHYEPPKPGAEAPWSRPSGDGLVTLLESWRAAKEQQTPAFPWLQSLRPPPFPLGGPERACLRGHEDAVTSVSWSPDGRRLASAAKRDMTVRVWDAETGAELACLRGHAEMAEKAKEVACIAWSPDGCQLASAATDETVRVWDAETGKELACLRGHKGSAICVSWSPDGRRLASGADDTIVRVWDAETGKELACLRGHKGSAICVSWSPDGRRLASASWDETVRVWDAETGKESACLREHESSVTSVAWSPDGRRLASGAWDDTVRVWDAETGVELACLRRPASEVQCVAWSPDGRRLASGGADDKIVRVWDVETGAELACLRGHEGWVTSVAWSPDGRRLASGGDEGDKTVRVWDAETDAGLTSLREHEWEVTSVSWSPDGRRLASAGGATDSTVRVWDAETGGELACLRGHEGWVMGVSWSPDGRRLASASWDNTVRVWDAERGKELACLRGLVHSVTSVAWSPDGRRLANAAEKDKTVRVWDAETGKESACLRGHEDAVTSVAWSPDGRRLASGALDDTVRVWDAETGAELACLRGHEGWVTSISWSPDGRRLASAAMDATVRVWNAETGEELACLRGHKRWVASVSWSPDGRRLASGAEDATVRVWDAQTGACLQVIEGTGDTAAIATGFDDPERFPWRALARRGETVIEPARGGEPIAWFPAELVNITTDPSGRLWAGSVGRHLYIIRLEGEPGCPADRRMTP